MVQLTRWPESEQVLAAVVVGWLRAQGFEVYQEVETGRGMPVADLVATLGRLLWVVEVKRSLSLALIEQADYWRGRAHYVSVAAPYAQQRRSGIFAGAFLHDVLDWRGIGLLRVGPDDVAQRIEPRLWRAAHRSTLRTHLREEQKTYAMAGNSDGARWTPYQHTCDQLRELVAKQPGISLRDAINAIQHHYKKSAVARSSLATWGQSGAIKGVRFVKENRSLRLYPENDVPKIPVDTLPL